MQSGLLPDRERHVVVLSSSQSGDASGATMALLTMPVKTASVPKVASPPACAMESSSSRMQRNFAEKQRRDKLNSYISELANIVPMVSMASKRLDKTSILRLSAAHLRFYQSEPNFLLLNPRLLNANFGLGNTVAWFLKNIYLSKAHCSMGKIFIDVRAPPCLRTGMMGRRWGCRGNGFFNREF